MTTWTSDELNTLGDIVNSVLTPQARGATLKEAQCSSPNRSHK
jgi:hypothetical protein